MVRNLLRAGLCCVLVAAGCSPAGETKAPFSLRLVKTVIITTDAEGGSARPEIVATPNRVFVLYLANIRMGGNRTFDVKMYDINLETVILSKVLVSTTRDYGGPTDIRVASDGQFLYAFYETNKPSSPASGTTYLWGAKYALDDNYHRVAYTSTPIISSNPFQQLDDGGERLDDPAPLIGPDSVFVITRLKYSISSSGQTIYRVRKFDKNDLTKLSEFDLNLSDVADGRGRVTSLLFSGKSILMALATTVSDQGIYEMGDDGALSDIILVRMLSDWTLDPQHRVRTLSEELGDRENYVSGFKTDGNYFYITYKQAVGRPPSGEQIGWIKVLDGDLHMVHKERLKSTAWGPGGGEIRPSLEVTGNRLYSGQSSGQRLGSGNAEIWVYDH